MITLILEFKKIENDDETKYRIFYLTQKLKKVKMMICLNQFILNLYDTYKSLLEKVQVGLLIQL